MRYIIIRKLTKKGKALNLISNEKFIHNDEIQLQQIDFAKDLYFIGDCKNLQSVDDIQNTLLDYLFQKNDFMSIIELIKVNPYYIYQSNEIKKYPCLIKFAITCKPEILDDKILPKKNMEVSYNFMKYLFVNHQFILNNYYFYKFSFEEMMQDETVRISFFKEKFHLIFDRGYLKHFFDEDIKTKSFFLNTYQSVLPLECFYNDYLCFLGNRNLNQYSFQKIKKIHIRNLENKTKETVRSYQSIFSKDYEQLNDDEKSILKDYCCEIFSAHEGVRPINKNINSNDYLSKYLKNINFIKDCIQDSILILPLSQKYKNSKDLWIEQIIHNPRAILKVPEQFLGDADFILILRNYINCILLYCDEKLLDNADFMLRYINFYSTQVNFRLGDNLKKDKEFIRKAVNLECQIMFHVDYSIRDDLTFMNELNQRNFDTYLFASSRVKKILNL